ncbi:MAG: rod shape-determining protein RodA [Desulfobacterales bacterium]|nr:rod shape-determining protein RodA [Desulfobacterales bacterium]
MFDRRPEQYFDWGLLAVTLLVATIGFLTLYSAVSAGATTPAKAFYIKQLIWYLVGLVCMVITILFNYKMMDRHANVIYVVCIVLLICVLFFGKYVGGSRRWLALGPISLQPSEMVKVGVIIILARYYAKSASTSGLTIRELCKPVIMIMIPFALIVKQPDLGTAMLIVLIAGSMTMFVKIQRRSLIYIMISGLISVPLVWSFLKGYQKQRILTFLNPDSDPLGTGYHIIQSKIAIGSGMLTGKGYLKGTQNALSFLPEQHTDFIFSVLAEEWGFIGAIALLVLLMILVAWGLNVAHSCRDPFGTILSVGVTATIFWQVFVNIGMTMGLMPVVGVPLPLVSYGGSSVITSMICIGILMNVSMRRFMID